MPTTQSDLTPSHTPVLLGESPAFARCLAIARRAARSDTSVLIMGESGTGKEGVARLIHEESPRREGRFVAVNCGAIPEGLVESELYGHARGAFTGAFSARAGKFALAHGGTLFLDEIGEMPPAAQVRLLRVLQERVVEPVGGAGPVAADFRLIAATHRDLRAEVRSGRFREDLWFRLHVVPVEIPPLRDRGSDVLVLARHFLGRFNARHGAEFSLTAEHEALLLGHAWPGNVRELENAVERAVVLTSGARLEMALDAASVREQARGAGERERLLAALEATRWNKAQAAEQLGISRRGLFYKIKAYGIA